jgi:hypothetical protein
VVSTVELWIDMDGWAAPGGDCRIGIRCTYYGWIRCTSTRLHGKVDCSSCKSSPTPQNLFLFILRHIRVSERQEKNIFRVHF